MIVEADEAEMLRNAQKPEDANDGVFSADDADLADKVKAKMEQGGDVVIQGADDKEAEDAEKGPLVKIDAKKATESDILNQADTKSAAFIPEVRNPDISEEDRAEFCDAIIANRRFKKSYSLFGNRLKVTFRSKTIEEADATITHILRMNAEGKLTSNVSRDALFIALALTACVERINHEVYDEMKGPFFKTPDAEPGWMSQFEYWAKQHNTNPARTIPIYECLKEFDSIYWKLVEDARKSDFFTTGGAG